MVFKKILSGLFIACGVVLLIYGLYVNYEIDEVDRKAEGNHEMIKTTSTCPKDQASGSATGNATVSIQGQESGFDFVIGAYIEYIDCWLEIGGVILIIVGGCIYYSYRKEVNRKS